MQVVGSLREGNAQAAAARANAEAADARALTERRIGAFEVARERRQQRRFMAQQAANAGSQGTALTGQPVDLLADSARQAQLDRDAIRFNAEIGAQGFETQADFDRFEARQARSAGFMRAGTALLTGASRIAGRFGGSSGTATRTPPIPRRRPF